jgi:hypothetical protein
VEPHRTVAALSLLGVQLSTVWMQLQLLPWQDGSQSPGMFLVTMYYHVCL